MPKFGGAPKCRVCKKSVYAMELMKYDDQIYHKTCFRCLECKKVLLPKSVAMMSGDLYCKDCFKKKFKARGKYDDITAVVPGTQEKPKPSSKAEAKSVVKEEMKKAQMSA
uniref:LIM zinc-binding domain-containing protein n=1 Tax=Amorphochlora amoebiformis TaxID=1561963 RepID=A0A7S0CXD8_9EUKA